MGLLDTLAAYKSPLTLLLVLCGPSLLPRLVRLGFRLRYQYNHPQPSRARPSRDPFTLPTIFILSLNAFYAMLKILFPSYDLFSYPSLPLFTSNLILRNRLLGPDANTADPGLPLEQLLLGRLQNLDTRLDYMRFGHQPLSQCVWCDRTPDYLLYALPLILAPYVYAGVLLGVLGLESVGGRLQGRQTDEWRWIFGLGLGGLAVGEIGLRYLWDLRPINGDVVHVSLHVQCGNFTSMSVEETDGMVVVDNIGPHQIYRLRPLPNHLHFYPPFYLQAQHGRTRAYPPQCSKHPPPHESN